MNETKSETKQEEAPVEQVVCTALLRCFHSECRHNDGKGECNLKCIEIDFEGVCIHRAPRDEAFLRDYLKRQGLAESQIEEIVKQAKKN